VALLIDAPPISETENETDAFYPAYYDYIVYGKLASEVADSAVALTGIHGGTVALFDRGRGFIAFGGRCSVRLLRRVHRKLPPHVTAHDGLRRRVRSDRVADSE
jgi:hypothetical protein